MDLTALLAIAHSGGVLDRLDAAKTLRKAPASEWTDQAPAVVATLAAMNLDEWRARQNLGSALRGIDGVAQLARHLLEPGSAHLSVGLALATFVGPSETLELRISELGKVEGAPQALAVVSGAAAAADLLHWMGKPYVSGDVAESIRAVLPALSALSTRQLARQAPVLIEALVNWLSVTGGDDHSDAVFDLLDRADLGELLRTLDAMLAGLDPQRRRWWMDTIARLADRSRWASELLELVRPSPDDEEVEKGVEEETDAPPPEASVFRRRG